MDDEGVRREGVHGDLRREEDLDRGLEAARGRHLERPHLRQGHVGRPRPQLAVVVEHVTQPLRCLSLVEEDPRHPGSLALEDEVGEVTAEDGLVVEAAAGGEDAGEGLVGGEVEGVLPHEEGELGLGLVGVVDEAAGEAFRGWRGLGGGERARDAVEVLVVRLFFRGGGVVAGIEVRSCSN